MFDERNAMHYVTGSKTVTVERSSYVYSTVIKFKFVFNLMIWSKIIYNKNNYNYK